VCACQKLCSSSSDERKLRTQSRTPSFPLGPKSTVLRCLANFHHPAIKLRNRSNLAPQPQRFPQSPSGVSFYLANAVDLPSALVFRNWLTILRRADCRHSLFFAVSSRAYISAAPQPRETQTRLAPPVAHRFHRQFYFLQPSVAQSASNKVPNSKTPPIPSQWQRSSAPVAAPPTWRKRWINSETSLLTCSDRLPTARSRPSWPRRCARPGRQPLVFLTA